VSFAVKIENLSVWIRGRQILKDVTLNIPHNVVYVIMGPSGSGKSTLLRTINRLIDLTPGSEVRGRVVVFGRDVYNSDPYELRKSIGMVFQTPNPFPHMTIYENVAIAAKTAGVARSKKELDQIVRWSLEKAMLWDEVKDRLHDYPYSLSGGQRQRLCLARALAMKPKLLLLDEPTANIDPVNARKLEEAIVSLKEDMTIVMVTHSPHQAARVADYVALIYSGEIIDAGPAKDLFLHPAKEFTARFLRGEI